MAWLQGLPVHTDVESLRPASADASFRRYFRVDAPGQPSGTLIAMDAPPDREDLRPFLYVAQLLRQAGLNAPAVLAADPQQGFALLSDLGTQTYLSVINERNADALFRDAIGALVRWQSATRADVLPPYDEALLQRELALYPEWYVARHLGVSLTAPQRATLDQQFRLLVQSALAQPRVFVHRDYMPRNLMVSDPNPGILDFQDAVCGPISYDIVSLLRDAFVSWEEERVLDWAIRYWEAARAAALPVPSDFAEFYRAFEWMGVQRHLKVLGIFARLRYRDGKPQYLEDAPRFVGYVRAVAHRYVGLAPLARLVDALEGIETRVSYTF
ncbi:MAG: phosphotransferase [Sutterellaceae bacterium]|nr:phosphotransferase [Burkholderiaceae bacterium]MCX7900756.1 phosphotransferase [Burkholderiaceae bacterium]MDW8429871.1 phosphotransferase [Sutterellaceae bacterium]